MSDIVLIAGGTGLVGKALRSVLMAHGYQVRLLGRSKPSGENEYQWDPSNQWIDEAALQGVKFIINLAGSNVGEGRWTKKRKSTLISSRIDSTRLLVNKCIDQKLPISKFIQVSASGYYGTLNGEHAFDESDPPGTDFLATLTKQWEDETQPLAKHHIPLLVLRLGVVLSGKGGALATMIKPVNMFVGMPLGSGSQFIPWIHINDVTGFICYSIEKPGITGVYNLVSPSPVTNKTFIKELGKALHKPIWPLHVPSFSLDLLLGEKAGIVTKGNQLSCKKLVNTGYVFSFPTLTEAIKHEVIAAR